MRLNQLVTKVVEASTASDLEAELNAFYEEAGEKEFVDVQFQVTAVESGGTGALGALYVALIHYIEG